MYISRVLLKNVRCFENFELSFDRYGESVLLAADNGDGKTTLLSCIAIGICDSSSAAALFRELKADLVRHGKKKGSIRVFLKNKANKVFEIETTINSFPKLHFESLEQSVYEYKNGRRKKIHIETFPWNKIFICAYGAGRQTRGTGDFSQYNSVDSVYSLFRYYEPHQNSELAFRRLVDLARKKGGRDPKIRDVYAKKMEDQLCRALKEILSLESKDKVELKANGISVRGRWGDCELDALSDGYKGTITWVLDFLWWRTLYQKTLDLKKMTGILMIDEIEQHLHPRWQQRILLALREIFPKIQFIATTHSPLVVSGSKNTRVHSIGPHGHEVMDPFGWLAEDVYREVMGIDQGTRAPEFEEKVLKKYEELDYKILSGKGSPSEHKERNALLRKLNKMLPESDPISMTVALDNITKSLKKKVKK